MITLENKIVKAFQDTWPNSGNFRKAIAPVIKEIKDLKVQNSNAQLAMLNILGEGKGQDWSDEPTEAMIAELRAWADKFHEMKKQLSEKHHDH
jgi:hypothetical protein